MNLEKYIAGIRLQHQLVEGKQIIESNKVRNKRLLEAELPKAPIVRPPVKPLPRKKKMNVSNVRLPSDCMGPVTNTVSQVMKGGGVSRDEQHQQLQTKTAEPTNNNKLAMQSSTENMMVKDQTNLAAALAVSQQPSHVEGGNSTRMGSKGGDLLNKKEIDSHHQKEQAVHSQAASQKIKQKGMNDPILAFEEDQAFYAIKDLRQSFLSNEAQMRKSTQEKLLQSSNRDLDNVIQNTPDGINQQADDMGKPCLPSSSRRPGTNDGMGKNHLNAKSQEQSRQVSQSFDYMRRSREAHKTQKVSNNYQRDASADSKNGFANNSRFKDIAKDKKKGRDGQLEKLALNKTQEVQGFTKSVLPMKIPLEEIYPTRASADKDLNDIDSMQRKDSNAASTEKCLEEQSQNQLVGQNSPRHIMSTTTFQHDQSPLKSTLRPGQNLMFTRSGIVQNSQTQSQEKMKPAQEDEESASQVYQMPQPISNPDQLQKIPRHTAATTQAQFHTVYSASVAGGGATNTVTSAVNAVPRTVTGVPINANNVTKLPQTAFERTVHDDRHTDEAGDFTGGISRIKINSRLHQRSGQIPTLVNQNTSGGHMNIEHFPLPRTQHVTRQDANGSAIANFVTGKNDTNYANNHKFTDYDRQQDSLQQSSFYSHNHAKISPSSKKQRRPCRQTNAEMQIAQRKQEICSLYKLAYQKDYNQSLNGSFKKQSSVANRDRLQSEEGSCFDSIQSNRGSGPFQKKKQSTSLNKEVSKQAESVAGAFLPDVNSGARFESTSKMSTQSPAAVHFSQFQMPTHVASNYASSQYIRVPHNATTQMVDMRGSSFNSRFSQHPIATSSTFHQKDNQHQPSNQSKLQMKRNSMPVHQDSRTKSQAYNLDEFTLKVDNEYDDGFQFAQIALSTLNLVKLNFTKNTNKIITNKAFHNSKSNESGLRQIQRKTENIGRSRDIQQNNVVEATLGSRDHDYSLMLEKIKKDQKIRHNKGRRQLNDSIRISESGVHNLPMRKQSTLRRSSLQDNNDNTVGRHLNFTQENQDLRSTLPMMVSQEGYNGSVKQSRSNKSSIDVQSFKKIKLVAERTQQQTHERGDSEHGIDFKRDAFLIQQRVSTANQQFQNQSSILEPLSCFDKSSGESVSSFNKKKVPVGKEIISNYGEMDITRLNKSIGFDKQSIKNVKTGAGEVQVSDESCYSKHNNNNEQQQYNVVNGNMSPFNKSSNDYTSFTRNSAIIKGQDTATLEPSDIVYSPPVEMSVNGASPFLNLKINVHEKDNSNNNNENNDLLNIQDSDEQDTDSPLLLNIPQQNMNINRKRSTIVKQRSVLKQFLHRPQMVQHTVAHKNGGQQAFAKQTPPAKVASIQQRKHLNLMLNSKKLQLCNRTEMTVNSEMRSVLRSQGKHPKELYDDYKVSLAKRAIQQQGYSNDNFNIQIEGGTTAAISITQCNTALQMSQQPSSISLPQTRHMANKDESTPREPQIGKIADHQSTKKSAASRNERLNTQEHEIQKNSQRMLSFVTGKQGDIAAIAGQAGPDSSHEIINHQTLDTFKKKQELMTAQGTRKPIQLNANEEGSISLIHQNSCENSVNDDLSLIQSRDQIQGQIMM